MNYISIDASIKSTAIIINNEHFINYPGSDACFTSKGQLVKWYEIGKDAIEYKPFTFKPEIEDNSQNEIKKYVDFELLTDSIINDILSRIKLGVETHVGLEGYSYDSEAGPLIDIVTFTTLLRQKLYRKVTKNIRIYPPTEVKKGAAQLTYTPIPLNKKETKFIWRNNDGIAGGHFKKHEIYKSIIENPKYSGKYVDLLHTIKDEMLAMGSIKKPFEDMNDSYIIYQLISSTGN